MSDKLERRHSNSSNSSSSRHGKRRSSKRSSSRRYVEELSDNSTFTYETIDEPEVIKPSRSLPAKRASSTINFKDIETISDTNVEFETINDDHIVQLRETLRPKLKKETLNGAGKSSSVKEIPKQRKSSLRTKDSPRTVSNEDFEYSTNISARKRSYSVDANASNRSIINASSPSLRKRKRWRESLTEVVPRMPSEAFVDADPLEEIGKMIELKEQVSAARESLQIERDKTAQMFGEFKNCSWNDLVLLHIGLRIKVEELELELKERRKQKKKRSTHSIGGD